MFNSSGLVLDTQGYFSRNNQRFVPVGVNYWPASCGVEMWKAWPAAEIQHDLDIVSRLGLNSIRFFLRWQDFEPDAGHYETVMFERLAQFLGWCRDRQLFAQPSLFVGWMSGQAFWPGWCANRNLFADPVMLEHAIAFTLQAVTVIAPFHVGLLGIDLGNELDALPESSKAAPEAVQSWCHRITAAIRQVYPNALIISGNDNGQVTNDSGWYLGQQPGTDLYSMHAYPVPGWHPVSFDGLTDPFCQSLLPFYTKVARAFGPVLVQEFGTIVTFGATQQDSYLRAILPACWAAGANGFLWWCLRDIHANVQPYLKDSFETTLGLVDADDQVKPGLEYYLEFVRWVQQAPAPVVSQPRPGLYWPKHYYFRADRDNPGNRPAELSAWLMLANYFLEQLGLSPQIVRGDLPLPTTLRTLFITGACLGSDELNVLETWVRAGGQLVWHGPDPHGLGSAGIRLLGAKPVDYRLGGPTKIQVGPDTWEFTHYPRQTHVELMPETARFIVRDLEGLPVLLSNHLGQGRVICVLPRVEETIARGGFGRIRRDRWQNWYAQILQLSEMEM
jgi:hypothetical protein